MNKTNYIEFKKKRELGSILGDTFAFLRTQFKPFFSAFFKDRRTLFSSDANMLWFLSL